jgi:Cof subfamily protein (haloacid dehalogenase superfamily)
MVDTLVTQPIKLIAVDLDGTLLTSDHKMSEVNAKAIKVALEAGIQVVIATGKTYVSATWLYEKLNLKTPGVFNQGTVICNADGSLRSQQTLSPQIARQIITFADDRDYLTGIYSGNRILVRKMHARIEQLTTYYHEPMPEAVGPLQNALDTTPVHKLIILAPDDPRRITALRWHIRMQVNGGGRALQTGIGDQLEILPPKSSKGAGVTALIKELGIPAGQVMAIGDGENDLEMLQLAGLGVAMGNAPESVKAVAKAVVSSNDQDGVAEAIRRFVLKGDSAEPENESKVIASPA